MTGNTWQVFSVSAALLPARFQVELPLNAKGLPACRRLALLYLRNADFPESIAELDQEEVTKPRPAARKISQSLAHEKKMLSLVNVFAILPAP